MSTTRFSCRLCMIRSHTVVFPDAVPPATPMRKGSLPPLRSTRASTTDANSFRSAPLLLPFPTLQLRSSMALRMESRCNADSAPGDPGGGEFTNPFPFERPLRRGL